MLFRLQVDQVIEACPASTLSDKLRSKVTTELTAPMATSNEIKKRKKLAKKAAKEEKVETVACSNGCFLGSVAKLGIYLAVIVGCMSQIEATRPTYELYAQPYVQNYIEVHATLQPLNLIKNFSPY